MDAEDWYIIPSRLFNENKPIILTVILFCGKNENKSKFFNNVSYFTTLDYKESKMFISIKRQEHFSCLQEKSVTRYMTDDGFVKSKSVCIKTEFWKSFFTIVEYE